MTSTTRAEAPPAHRHRRLAPRAIRVLWEPRTWFSTIHVVLGLPLGIATFVPSVVLLAMTLSMAITAIFAVVTLWALVIATRIFTTVQRSRFRATLGVEIPATRRLGNGSWWRRLLADVGSGTFWRQVVYHVQLLITGTAGFTAVVTTWSVGLILATLPIHGWIVLPDQGVFDLRLRQPWLFTGLTVLGWVVLLSAPWVARAAAAVDVALAGWLLGPSRSEQLSQRVETLTESRAGAVDAADAERRRIERDLHDGAQQRLVSLAMNLGMARAKLADADAPRPAREAIEQAHEEAKEALAELRDFVRGLHPAVLNDRGLDAALSGVAARAPIPVQLRVEVDQRPSPTIEAVAYFVVSEALTNVAKHARASRTEVTVRRTGQRLSITISDDGAGGATTERGTGLRGLAQRVASVDGSLHIDSPPGGPTVIMVELPCE